jgi:hypothetical protein
VDLFCGLFKDAASSSDSIAAKDRATDEKRIGKGIEKSGRGPI